MNLTCSLFTQIFYVLNRFQLSKVKVCCVDLLTCSCHFSSSEQWPSQFSEALWVKQDWLPLTFNPEIWDYMKSKNTKTRSYFSGGAGLSSRHLFHLYLPVRALPQRPCWVSQSHGQFGDSHNNTSEWTSFIVLFRLAADPFVHCLCRCWHIYSMLCPL